MIKIENVEVYGWEAAIRGMRNSWDSWGKSDTNFETIKLYCGKGKVRYAHKDCKIGSNDLALMKKLCKAGSDHRKFMRFIVVTADIVAPLYWWKEFDTYKVGTVRNSCSTMHKITENEFTFKDFSHEHLLGYDDIKWGDTVPTGTLECVVRALNFYRKKYIKTNDKKYWWQMIQLLPSSYNQKSTVQMNYEVLRAMYHARKNHKLDEWRDFCKWIETLPYSEIIMEA